LAAAMAAVGFGKLGSNFGNGNWQCLAFRRISRLDSRQLRCGMTDAKIANL